MATWTDPPAFGCVVAVDRLHDWQWVRPAPRRGRLISWLAPAVLLCARCAQSPYQPPPGLGRSW